jgi:hypothetical protein
MKSEPTLGFRLPGLPSMFNKDSKSTSSIAHTCPKRIKAAPERIRAGRTGRICNDVHHWKGSFVDILNTGFAEHGGINNIETLSNKQTLVTQTLTTRSHRTH